MQFSRKPSRPSTVPGKAARIRRTALVIWAALLPTPRPDRHVGRKITVPPVHAIATANPPVHTPALRTGNSQPETDNAKFQARNFT